MKFSERNGFVSIDAAMQLNSISSELRNSLWNVLYLYILSSKSDFRRSYSDNVRLFAVDMCLDVLKKPIHLMPETQDIFVRSFHNWFDKAEFYEIFDLFEFVIENRKKYVSTEYVSALPKSVSDALVSERSAYRLVRNRFVPITSDDEIAEVTKAASAAGFRRTSALHIAEAVKILSDKTRSDFRNAVKEAISAVEAAARHVTGDDKATLGKALAKLESKAPIHAAMKDAFSKLYGYSSDANGIRHALLTEDEIGLAEARFMVIACSAFTNLLFDRAESLR